MKATGPSRPKVTDGPTIARQVTLVALYFACNESLHAHGEVIAFIVREDVIKFFDSDTVSCIANLARLSPEDKEDLASVPTTAPTLDFTKDSAKRLHHFIADEKPYFTQRIKPADLHRALVVRPKLSSRRSLDALNINEGALYLDIDSHAKYLKKRYGL